MGKGYRWRILLLFFFFLSLDRQVLLVHSVLYLRTSHPVFSAPPRKAGTTHAIAQSREASEAFSCEHSRVASVQSLEGMTLPREFKAFRLQKQNCFSFLR